MEGLVDKWVRVIAGPALSCPITEIPRGLPRGALPGPALVSAANAMAFPPIRAAALVLSHQLRTGDSTEFEIQLSNPCGPFLF